MGIEIDMRGSGDEPPTIKLTCDGYGMFHSPPFVSTLPYPKARSLASAEGWVERFVNGASSRHDSRLFLGPCCSGKKVVR